MDHSFHAHIHLLVVDVHQGVKASGSEPFGCNLSTFGPFERLTSWAMISPSGEMTPRVLVVTLDSLGSLMHMLPNGLCEASAASASWSAWNFTLALKTHWKPESTLSHAFFPGRGGLSVYQTAHLACWGLQA